MLGNRIIFLHMFVVAFITWYIRQGLAESAIWRTDKANVVAGQMGIFMPRLSATAGVEAPSSPNTVQLGHHGLFWCPVGLWPVVVVGSFDVPSGVLAFDDSGVGARSSWGDEPADEFADRVSPESPDGVVCVRGERRPVGR